VTCPLIYRQAQKDKSLGRFSRRLFEPLRHAFLVKTNPVSDAFAG
jgi:hypothetical protein